jgi:anthranilate phosphoribosyltransferase
MPHNRASTLGRVSGGENLSMDEAADAMNSIMDGRWSDTEIGLFLTALAAKGETIDEVAGAATALRQHMTPIRSRHTELLDTCGTGGGGSKLFNISTTAAIVAAAAGVPVAKHGNRSITSRSGSADVLAELGVNLNATVPQVEACLDELGLCFCFAPLAHSSMRHVAAVRKQLGTRTIFNILGPLANPAGACYQLLGAGRPELRPLLAGAMAKLGTKRTLVVSGEDGLGDVTLAGITYVTEVTASFPLPLGEGRDEGATELGQQEVARAQGGSPENPIYSDSATLRDFTWRPEGFGIQQQPLTDLSVDGPAASASLIRRILAGNPGPARDIVVLNAAAGLLAASAASDPLSAAAKASQTIDTGAARDLLRQLAERSHQPA